MSRRFFALILLTLSLPVASLKAAADSRADFLFRLSSALHSHDRVALARCFNFQGTTDEGRLETLSILEKIMTWPNPYMITSERKEAGALSITKEGKPYTLNGDWSFQVHIYEKKPPSKGFVFPAGTVNGNYGILLLIPAAK